MTELARTIDAFLGGRLSILQPRAGYRAGIDAVLLAAAVPAHEAAGERVLDAGAGVGVVGLAVATRVADVRVTLVEIDAGLARVAGENVRRNDLGERVDVVVADIVQGGAALHDPQRPAGLDPGAFAHVAANPPYHRTGAGTAPAVAHKAQAHQMERDGLDRWAAFLATAAAGGGTLTLIHRAEALGEVLAAFAGRFGSLRVLPVHPRAGAPAHRVLIRGVKGSRAPLVLLAGLVLQDENGRYLPAIDDVLRHGKPLAL